MLFRDRDEAGDALAEVLLNFRRDDPIVLGIPRGGVLVARRVADRLGAPLGAVDEAFMLTDAAQQASGRTVLLVDDGISTGATMLAALELVAECGPRRLIAAVPVAPQRISFGRRAADLYAVARPAPFSGVARWYRDLPPATDEDVRAALGDQDWAYAGATSL